MCDYHAPWLLSSLFQGRASGWLSLGGDFDISSTQPGLLQHLCWLCPCRYLELAAAGLRRSSSSQLLRNTLWGQAGAFQQLYATLSESHNKQAQALLLDFGNCCLRDRFTYKYLLFLSGFSLGKQARKRYLCFSAVASSHLSSSSSLFQPPKFSLANETIVPMSGGRQMPVILEADGKTQVLSNWAEHMP